MTPRQAIRAYCMACCNGQRNEVVECPARDCPLYSRRMGDGEGAGTVKAIKERCEDCLQSIYTSMCNDERCPLHPFRLGKNPNRAGIGNKKAVLKEGKKE